MTTKIASDFAHIAQRRLNIKSSKNINMKRNRNISRNAISDVSFEWLVGNKIKLNFSNIFICFLASSSVGWSYRPRTQNQ